MLIFEKNKNIKQKRNNAIFWFITPIQKKLEITYGWKVVASMEHYAN